MIRNDIEQLKGASFSYQINFSGISNGEPTPLDISGDVIYFTIKNCDSSLTGDSDAIYSQDVISHLSAISGISIVSYPSATGKLFNVGSYNYDIIWGKSDGDIVPLVGGKFNIVQNITTRY